MPILLLIRHATNDFVKTGRLPGQSPNIHLNAEGQAQAEALGRFLTQHKLSAVYSSHLERAIETAWRIAAPQGLGITVRPDLADTHAGDFTGKTVKELAESPETKDAWTVIVEKPSEGKLPNGESLLDMQRRIVAALDQICAAHPDPQPDQRTTGSGNAGAGNAGAAPEHEGQGNPAATSLPSPPTPPVVAVVMHADPIKAALAHYLGMPFDNFQRLATAPASIQAVMVATHAKPPMNVSVMSVNATVPVVREQDARR